MTEFYRNILLGSIFMGKSNERNYAEEAEVDKQSVVILTRIHTLYVPAQTNCWLQNSLHLERDMTLGKAVFSMA